MKVHHPQTPYCEEGEAEPEFWGNASPLTPQYRVPTHNYYVPLRDQSPQTPGTPYYDTYASRSRPYRGNQRGNFRGRGRIYIYILQKVFTFFKTKLYIYKSAETVLKTPCINTIYIVFL